MEVSVASDHCLDGTRRARKHTGDILVLQKPQIAYATTSLRLGSLLGDTQHSGQAAAASTLHGVKETKPSSRLFLRQPISEC